MTDIQRYLSYYNYRISFQSFLRPLKNREWSLLEKNTALAKSCDTTFHCSIRPLFVWWLAWYICQKVSFVRTYIYLIRIVTTFPIDRWKRRKKWLQFALIKRSNFKDPTDSSYATTVVVDLFYPVTVIINLPLPYCVTPSTQLRTKRVL